MTTLETDSAEIPAPATQEALPVAQDGKGDKYKAVRFNAMRHGILSRYTVLAHEDANEYRVMLSALMEEYKPAKATEAHLVEELGGIIWRKRRVMQAEGASINRGLTKVVKDAAGVIPAAAPFEFDLSGEGADLRECVEMKAKEIAQSKRDTKHDFDAIKKAAAILWRGSASAYDSGLRALPSYFREQWQACVRAKKYPVTAEGLVEFIRNELVSECLNSEKLVRHHAAIKKQALGEGLQVHRLENLTRYETHLDRKFERTLAMLLKLKELRSG